ncbi:MAG: Ldh family oxidoreductase [Planctomycetota bacterium]|nr:Ldh family oxidoreductase [Planctomycetota bacterium]
MSNPSTQARFSHDALRAAAEGALTSAGVPAAIAQVESELMAEADLMGTPSHGVRMLPRLIQAIRNGGVRRAPDLRLSHDFAATCVLEGDRGPGRYVSVQAMNHAVDRGKRFGIGACLARETSHWGRAHAYAYRAAQAGLIGICTTNALPSILAYGSNKPLLGNNPLAIGVPRGQGRDPVVLDIAMSQAAVGKIETYRRLGKRTPLDWGLDSAGQPTDDPAAILASRKFLPMGGHKGAGLALMLEMLTSVLAGGALCHEMARTDASGADALGSKLFMAIHPEAFGDRARFEQRADDLLDHLRNSVTDGPGEAIHYPGQHGWQTRDRCLAEGIPLDPQTIADLQGIGVKLEAKA